MNKQRKRGRLHWGDSKIYGMFGVASSVAKDSSKKSTTWMVNVGNVPLKINEMNVLDNNEVTSYILKPASL